MLFWHWHELNQCGQHTQVTSLIALLAYCLALQSSIPVWYCTNWERTSVTIILYNKYFVIFPIKSIFYKLSYVHTKYYFTVLPILQYKTTINFIKILCNNQKGPRPARQPSPHFSPHPYKTNFEILIQKQCRSRKTQCVKFQYIQ